MTSMTELKNEEGKDLRPCVRCHSTQILETYFSKNRRGDYYKTCDRCRLKHHCDQCDYKTAYENALERHMVIHTGRKDFKCERCEKKFTRDDHLKRHIKICIGVQIASAGERAAMNALADMNVLYEQEVCEFKNENNNWLRFDFKIVRGTKTLFIEYDGRQHTRATRFRGISDKQAQAAFEKLQHHDELKNKWCAEHGHPLLRIPYTQFGNIPQLITEFMTEHTNWGDE